ncbi:MAG: Crp/Fnr family transcriptional regulator [Rhodanobacteraceae bacterium]
MSDLHSELQKNLLLAALPAEDLARIEPHLELVDLALGDVVYEAGREQTHLFFPLDCIVSLLYVMEDGDTGEMAIIGNDGVVGVALFMGGQSMASRAVVQSAGSGLRIKADIVRKEFGRAGALQQLLLRYVQVMLAQMGQTAVCNRHHTVEQQLCRWLLMSLDRLPGNELTMTQELIANMLGVRREGVTEAAGRLQKEHIISYSRGRIKVLDRARLEQASCECYQVVRDEMDRLLPREPSAARLVQSA